MSARLIASTCLLLIAQRGVPSTAPAQVATPAPLTLSVQARAIQPGEVALLTIETTTPADVVHVRAFDRDIPAYRVDAKTWRALVGIDLEAKAAPETIAVETSVSGRIERATHVLRILPKAFPTRTLKVDDAFVNPPASAAAKIEQDGKDLDRCWNNPAAERLWSGAFIRPVPQPANSAFGSRSVFNGVAKSPHTGADFLSPAGTPIHAPAAGRVVLAHELYYAGNTVIIDHGLGLFSFLCHMSRIDAHEGDAVKANDVIGLVGATGRVTGAHLHWAVRLNGARVDPLSLVAALESQKPR